MTYLATVQLPRAGTETGRQIETKGRDQSQPFGQLVDVGGAWDYQQLLVSARGVRIGRQQGFDIILPDDFGTISREHALISPDQNGRVYVRDLGSRNGTFVNGNPVTQKFLEPGDEIQLGSDSRVKFKYEV